MKGEYYKMEYEAWDEGTDELSLELEAAYLRLCHQMYRRHGAIPDHLNTLCRIWRCHANKAKKLIEALIHAGKVRREDGHLTNTRVRRELDDRESLSSKRADAGHKGGTRSAQKVRTQRTQTLDAPHTHPRRSAQSDDNSLKDNDADAAIAHIREKRREDISSLRSDNRHTPTSELRPVLDASHAEAVVEHRKKLRKPLTAHAASLLAKKFASTPDPNAAADAMIANGWQGFEPEWLDGRNRGPPNEPGLFNGQGRGNGRKQSGSEQMLDALREYRSGGAAPGSDSSSANTIEASYIRRSG